MKGSRGGGGVDRCFYNCILWNAGNLDREELKWTPHHHTHILLQPPSLGNETDDRDSENVTNLDL